MRTLLFTVYAFVILTGCSTKYVIYETPYCIESIAIPPPESILNINSIKLSDLPCNTNECGEFIQTYQVGEINLIESVSNWISEAKLRLEQYGRRVDLCNKANIIAKQLITDKVNEVGEMNVEINMIPIE